MSNTSDAVATNSSIRLSAADDVILANIAGSNVSIVSGGDIVNAAGSTKNVTAINLRLNANGEIGTASRHLTTNIDNISAISNNGSIFVTEDDGVTVTDVAVTVNGVIADASTTAVTDLNQSDLVTGSNGDIVLVATLGNITLEDGIDNDDQSVSANGTGSILIDANGGSVTANADILSGIGQITLEGNADVNLSATVNVITASTGTVSFKAENGALTMDGTANVEATSSSARLMAEGSITLGNVTATNVSILSNAAVINAAGSTKNVTATNLRIEAVNSIGVSGRHITTNIDNVSALSETGSIFLTEDNGAVVTNATVTVTEFNADATTTVVTDLNQSDLVTSSTGDIVLVATLGNITLEDGIDADGAAVSADDGVILVQAVSGQITGNADVTTTMGALSILALGDVIFNADADVSTTGNGTIDIQATNGVITFATDADQSAANGDVRLAANGNITLGGTTTTLGSVSLISTIGNIIDGDNGAGLDFDAGGLRVSAAQFGAASNPVETNVDQFTANTATGIFITDSSAIAVGTVSSSVDRVAANATTAPLSDLAQTGAIATTGDIEISAELSITVETIQTTGDVVLISNNGGILDGGEGDTDVIAANLTITASNGIGSSGIGGLELDVDTLGLTNDAIGSVYLNLLSTTTLLATTLSDAGSLFISQSSGSLTVDGIISLSDGRAILTTPGALTINADVTTTDYFRIVADSLDVNNAALTVAEGDLEIRVRNDLDFDASSSANATLGDINLTVGGEARVADMTAGGNINIRAREDILRVAGEIEATNLKISSLNGQIGASAADPILTNVDRLDASAAGEVFISELDGVDFGRSGLVGGGENPGETLTFTIGTGELGSVTGNIEFTGQGTFLIESTGDLTLATGITATNGNITIVTATLADGTASEDILLEARNGRVSIIATGGVGSAGVLDIEIASNQLTTTTTTGDLALELRQDTTMVGSGITIGSGSGALIVDQTIGNLFINANMAHLGSGLLNIDTVGTLTMNSIGRITTNSGSMDVFASGDFFISQVRTTSGTIRLESANGSVDNIAGFTLANIISVTQANVFVDEIADFTVLSNSVRVNVIDVFFRSQDETLIFILADYTNFNL